MLDYVALGLLAFVAATFVYALIAVHDIPAAIARRRDHPHADAIEAAGWVSLFTLHAIWPLLWIWAMAYRPDRGWGIAGPDVRDLERRIAAMEARTDRPATP